MPAAMDAHEQARLVVAVDWAITAASRRMRAGGGPVAVTVADVIARAADDGLAVAPAAAAAEVLRTRFALRGGAFGLTTDAFDTCAGGPPSGGM
jgi:hypothetical protein